MRVHIANIFSDSSKRGRWLRNLTMLGLAVAGTLPFVFQNSTPEGDLYYVGYSISRFVQTGTRPAHMSAMYDLAPAYYILYSQLFDILSVPPGKVLSFLNYGDWLASLGLSAVLGLVLRELRRTDQVPYFMLMLFLMPSYWYVGLYAHPITLSTVLVLCSFLCFLRYTVARNAFAGSLFWFTAALLYAAALLFRPDAAFLFLLFPATVFSLDRKTRGSVFGTIALLVAAASLYLLASRLLPGHAPQPSLPFESGTPSLRNLQDYLTSFFGRVWAISDYGLWTESLGLLLHAIGLGGVVVSAAALAVVAQKNEWRRVLPPLLGIACVVAVWIGHPIHVRRYYQVSILIVLLAYSAFASIEREGLRRRFVALCIAVLLGLNLILPVGAREALRIPAIHESRYAGFVRFLSYDGALDLSETHDQGPNVLERAYTSDSLGPGIVFLLGTWSDVGATSYYLQSKGRVLKDRSFRTAAGGELFASNVLELTDGSKAVLVELEPGGADSLEYILRNGREYLGSSMVLLTRECGEDLAELRERFRMVYVADGCRG